MDFGKRLRLVRMIRELSQQELSRQLHINIRYISDIERGFMYPNQDFVNQLRAALGWTERVDALLDELAAELERGQLDAA